jgi:dissimilatory sulfite reductase (desulfoviridin) alpha/beta subunit
MFWFDRKPYRTLFPQISAFYREQGKFPERLAATIERVGFDTFVKAAT